MRKKKTHEEYVTELAIKNPTLEVIDEYIDSKTPIKHRCLIHDIYFYINPTGALKGNGCEFCRRDKIKKSRMKTNEQYIEELKIKNQNIIPLEEYIDSRTPISHLCKIHNIEWVTAPYNVLEGHGCPNCKSKKIIEKHRKSNECYVEELKNKNPNIIPLEKYKGANTPILHKCLVDGYEWFAQPGNMLSGCGCPKCSQRFRRTNKDYIEELSLKNPDIEPLEEFKGMTVPILHKCKKHNVEWMVIPDNIFRGCGCPECGKEKIGIKNTKSRDEYIKEAKLEERHIELIGEYINATTPVLHKCLIDGYEWLPTPSNILDGKGCPKCANVLKKTQEQYVNEVALINSDIEVLEEYINANIPILHRCKKHDIKWKSSPSSILQGCGCYECGIKKLKIQNTKSHEQYVEELSQVNPNIIVLEKYINANTPILHKCLVDGCEWFAIPARILSGCGCPRCKESKGEREIRLWLQNNNIKYEFQKSFKDCRDTKPLPFDFYLPNFNILIEYDGLQHYEPVEFFGGQEHFEYIQKHDNMKNEYCKENGILLLRIPYFKNIEEELNNFLFI